MKRYAGASKRDFALHQKNSRRKNRPKTLPGRNNNNRIPNLDMLDERIHNRSEDNGREIIRDNNPGLKPIREDFIFD